MLRVASLFLAFCFAASSVSSHGCRRGWTLFEGKCYGYGEVKVSWAEAAAICIAYNAKLVEVETSEENDYVKKLGAAKGGGYVWAGGNDIFHEGIWEWIVNGDKVHPYSDWIVGHPNDAGAVEECLAILPRSSPSWNDVPCTNLYNFICEQRAPRVSAKSNSSEVSDSSEFDLSKTNSTKSD